MRVVVAAILLLFASNASAQTATGVSTGVLDLESSTIPAAELRVLSDRLRIELFNTGQFRIIERERMDAVSRRDDFQLGGCMTSERSRNCSGTRMARRP
jgi:hypothetical protein